VWGSGPRRTNSGGHFIARPEKAVFHLTEDAIRWTAEHRAIEGVSPVTVLGRFGPQKLRRHGDAPDNSPILKRLVQLKPVSGTTQEFSA
jgi:hypothetical protein